MARPTLLLSHAPSYAVRYCYFTLVAQHPLWLPLAQEGDPEAQTYVGEIHEKGMGTPASHELAAYWYQRAVEQNYSRAQINLGYLYESGLGVERDLTRALNLYRQAAGFTAAELEFVSPKIAAQRKADSKKTEALQQTAILTSRALESATEEIDSLNEQISNLQARLTQTPADPEPLLKQNDQQQELDKLRSEMDKLKSEHTQKTGMLETLKLELASAQAQLESTSGNIAQTSLRSANAQRNQPTQQTSGQATAQLTEKAPNESVAPTVSNAAYSDIAFGNYHALVIGNDTYRSVGNLQTAGNDAIAVEQIFREKYGFNTHASVSSQSAGKSRCRHKSEVDNCNVAGTGTNSIELWWCKTGNRQHTRLKALYFCSTVS